MSSVIRKKQIQYWHTYSLAKICQALQKPSFGREDALASFLSIQTESNSKNIIKCSSHHLNKQNTNPTLVKIHTSTPTLLSLPSTRQEPGITYLIQK